MADLVEWLRIQLNEDEAAAEDTLSMHVRVGRFRGVGVQRWRITKSGTGVIDEDGGTLRAQQIFPAEAAHVIRHDPARALREANALRQLLALHSPSEFGAWVGDDDDQMPACRTCGDLTARFPCKTLRLLASVYADRDGYQEAWRP